jgi:hypothetical protein
MPGVNAERYNQILQEEVEQVTRFQKKREIQGNLGSLLERASNILLQYGKEQINAERQYTAHIPVTFSDGSVHTCYLVGHLEDMSGRLRTTRNALQYGSIYGIEVDHTQNTPRTLFELSRPYMAKVGEKHVDDFETIEFISEILISIRRGCDRQLDTQKDAS